MIQNRFGANLFSGLALAGLLAATSAAQTGSSYAGQQFTLPNTGQQITPLAPTGAQYLKLNPNLADFPGYVAGQAVTSAVSPDGNTLFVLTSGYNLVNNPTSGNSDKTDSTEFVFIYDITSPANPVQKQAIPLYNTYTGLAVDPTGTAFYVAGGVDDTVHIFTKPTSTWTEATALGSPVNLGHYFATNPYFGTSQPFFNAAAGLVGGVGLAAAPESCGVAISPDGVLLVVTNYYNDSITILKKVGPGGSWFPVKELDLRPGKAASSPQHGVAGGEYPYWVVVKGNATAGYTAYVSSIRDREVDVVTGLLATPVVSTRIAVSGQPNKMTLDSAQHYLYVAEDNSDSVGVIDTGTNALVETIPVSAPAGVLPAAVSTLKGNDTNSVTLSPDGTKLYVTNGGMNDVAVVNVSGPAPHPVIGLIPTGWYPTSVSFSGDGSYVYVLNYKSPTGPNGGSPFNCGKNCYNLQLIKAGLQVFPVPTTSELQTLTTQVATNNSFAGRSNALDVWTMAALRAKIQHVIYIIKENRTYDQVLGDLPVGNGDPTLTEWGQAVTPNLHAIASQFVDLDNFYDTSEVSMDGWPWSTSAHAIDTVERQTSVNYAGRCVSYFPSGACAGFPGPMTYDSEGSNRNVNIGVATLAGRTADLPLMASAPFNDPDLLPGTNNAGGADGPGTGQKGAGFLWDAALRAGKTVRDYGMFVDEVRYQLAPFGPPLSYFQIPTLRYPFNPTQAPYDQVVPNPLAAGAPFGKTQVAYSTSPSLQNYTDPYFRGFDQNMSDFYLFQEFSRDVDANGLANLALVRLAHDHTGNFSTALDGVNTPELQTADNDFAVGLVAQKIANSPLYRNNTLIFVIEDDSQAAVDHVDSHRSIAFVIGPYVKRHAVVSTQYSTINMYRTIEDILGTAHSNLNDALAYPMTAVFDLTQNLTTTPFTFTANPSLYLQSTGLVNYGLPATHAGLNLPRSTHDAAYWAKVTAGMDFTKEDAFDFDSYNRILWKGLMGSRPYPSGPTGLDLRANRAELLRRYHEDLEKNAAQSTPVKQEAKPVQVDSTKSGS